MQKGNKNNLTVRVVASECKFDSIIHVQVD